ncbi:MAG: GntR family transcriptional regulator [Planctomycetes bacterium]|nr:GntR family transcriptional regulator [Planctomycetota bacterium]
MRRRIAKGVYAPGTRLPTEVELPKLLDAGKQTVVRALNDLVREGLIYRRRGDGTYVTDRAEPPLVPGRHIRIGVLWPRSVLAGRLETEFQGAITRGMLASWGLDRVTPLWSRSSEREPTGAVWTNPARGVTAECLGESVYTRLRHPDLEAVRAGRFDALVSVSIIEEAWLESLLGLGKPTLLVDFPNERFAQRADQVFVDPVPGYRAVVRRFAEEGLRRIHFVGGYMGVPDPTGKMTTEEYIRFQRGRQRVDPDSYLRLSAYRMAIDECGLTAGEEMVHFTWYGPETCRPLVDAWMALPATQRPDALVCHSAGQAEELMAACSERGLYVKAAGCADERYGGPAIGIHADGMELGRAAATLLLGRMHWPDRLPLRVGVPMRLDRQRAAPQPVPSP